MRKKNITGRTLEKGLRVIASNDGRWFGRMANVKPKPVKVGEILGGKYRVERVIGEGGMGIVVAAKHMELHQRVAVKLLLDDALADAEQVERFLREARAAVRLKSEHAAKVLDVGKLKNGAPFMVMELLEGEDLAQIVARGPLLVDNAVDFILQACEAIAEAHALGIVHRDLKPRNLFLTRKVHGRALVKVLDFGLAKTMHPPGAAKALTQPQAVMGSPQYMSPEQMKSSRDVDRRTDIWSIGVCLYELLAGIAPYDAVTLPELFAMIITADPPRPLTEIRPEVPEGLWQVVRKCLQKNPADRFADVAELGMALEVFAPASAYGAAERISAVLYAIPTSLSDGPPHGSEPPTGRTDAAFESGSRDRSTSSLLLMVGGGGIAVLSVLALIGILVFRHPTTTATDMEADAGASAAVSQPAAPNGLPSGEPSASAFVDPPAASTNRLGAPPTTPPALTKPLAPAVSSHVPSTRPKRRPDAGEDPNRKY